MARVSDVVLSVGDRAGGDGRRTLRVEYSVTFEAWERGAWFQERVTIHGLVGGVDTELAELTGPAFEASDTVSKRRPPSVLLDAKASERLYAAVQVVPQASSRGDARSPEVPCNGSAPR